MTTAAPSRPRFTVGMKEVSFSELVQPKPKQRDLIEALWRGTMTGSPEFLLWGGSAGPGKSYGIRWAAILFTIKCAKVLGVLGVQVGLFSIDYPRLRDRHINEFKKMPSWLGTYNESTHDFTLKPHYGSGVVSLRNADDPEKYASAQFAALFFEELTEFDRDDFNEIVGRKRWPGVPYSPVVAVCNPRGKGLHWVRKLWIEHDFSGPKDEGLADAPFWFLQAYPSDNDSLPPSYYKTLERMPAPIRKALLEGNWYVSIDQAFPDFTRWKRDSRGEFLRLPPTEEGQEHGGFIPWHVIPTQDVPEQWRRIASHDWGYASPGHHLWGAVDPRGGIVIYREWSFKGLDPRDIAAGVLFRQGDEGVTVTYADPSIWQERKKSDLSQDQIDTLAEAGKLILSKASQYREGGLDVVRANNARVAGKARIHTLLKDRGDGVPYLRIMDSCPVLASTLQNIMKDPDKNEDVITEYLADDDLRDDSYDALRYLLMGVPAKMTEPPVSAEFQRRAIARAGGYVWG